MSVDQTIPVKEREKKEAFEVEHTRYIDFKMDFSFRHFFARENHFDLLKDFLNGVFEGRKVIKELRLGKTERKGDQKENRGTIFDVYCTDDNGDSFVVEMQKGSQLNFKDRILFYTANLIQEQGKSVDSDWNYRLTEIYFVAVMDFIFEDTAPEYYVHDVRLVEIRTQRQFYDKLGYIYIELPKFCKTANQLETSEDKWLYCLKNMKILDEIPLPLSNDPIFKKLFKVAEVSNLTPAEMSAYQKELKRKRDNYSREEYILHKAKQSLEQAVEQGMQQGIEQGIEQGIAQGIEKGIEQGLEQGIVQGIAEGIKKGESNWRHAEALEIAREMKKDQFSIEKITKLTKLSAEEIQELK